MSSRDFGFLTLRNATAYEENNSFVQPNRLFVTSSSGNVVFSDNIRISSINATSINVSSLNASTINVSTLNSGAINTSTLDASTIYSDFIYASTLNGSTINTVTLNASTINGSTINGTNFNGSTIRVSSIASNSVSTSNITTDNLSTFGNILMFDVNLSTLEINSLGSTLYIDGQPVVTEATISTISSIFWDELAGGTIYNKNIGVAPLYYQVGVGTQTTAINGTLDVQYRGGVTAGNVLHVSTGNNSRLIYDSNGALTCEGELVADFINTNALNVSGEIEWGEPSSYVAPIEGGAVVWNTIDAGTGHTEFINARGSGIGGFLFYDGLDGSATSSLTKLASLDTSGLTIYSTITCQQLNSNFVSTGQLSGGSINMSGSTISGGGFYTSVTPSIATNFCLPLPSEVKNVLIVNSGSMGQVIGDGEWGVVGDAINFAIQQGTNGVPFTNCRAVKVRFYGNTGLDGNASFTINIAGAGGNIYFYVFNTDYVSSANPPGSVIVNYLGGTTYDGYPGTVYWPPLNDYRIFPPAGVPGPDSNFPVNIPEIIAYPQVTPILWLGAYFVGAPGDAIGFNTAGTTIYAELTPLW